MPREDQGDSFEFVTDILPRDELTRSVARHGHTLSWSDAAGAQAVRVVGRMVLGSSPNAHVRIQDRGVSRVHAEVEVAADGLWLRDLDSRNGTYVNGVLCRVARIEDGMKIRVGETVLHHRNEAVEEIPLWPHERLGALVARSEPMRELFMTLTQYAKTDAPVLVQGETGTGKELVARALHDASPRAKAPFVVVDCGALPETLLESELFGHVRGAFTGAVSNREGAFEAADGGTVFLDEIGELPLAMQPKLLRALEDKTVRRIGETTHRKVNVRFVSATHRDLQKLVAAGAFREDLYFRLAVLPTRVPPLRARPMDVSLLASYFLSQRAPGLALPASVAAEMESYPWLGNVRELRSFVDRVATVGAEAAWALTRGASTATPEAPPPADPFMAPVISPDTPFKVMREQWNDHLERDYIRQMIERHGRKLSAIATAAGIDRSYIRRLIERHGL